MLNLALVAVFFIAHSVAFAASRIPVRVGVLQARPEIPTEFYFDELQSALYYAAGENDAKLSRCGYNLQFQLSFYIRDDKLAPKEKAHLLEDAGAWAILGPSESYDFLIATKGLTSTAMISPWAGARAVTDLKAPYFTMYPSIDLLAKAAYDAAKKQRYGKRYGVFVDAACPSCKDFALEFERFAQNEFDKQFWIEVVGDTPDLLSLETEITVKKIDFLVMPNYNPISGYTIFHLQNRFPRLKFIGADDWGDELLPAFENFRLLPGVRGLHVRGGRSATDMRDFFKTFSLQRQWKGEPVLPSLPAFMAVDFVRQLTDDLCEWKPKNKKDFFTHVSRARSDHYKDRIGVGVYHLVGNQNQFLRFLAEK